MKKPFKKEFQILGGYTVRWDSSTGEQGALVQGSIQVIQGKDHGADPIGNGQFKMIPSGDVVDLTERNRRLRHK